MLCRRRQKRLSGLRWAAKRSARRRCRTRSNRGRAFAVRQFKDLGLETAVLTGDHEAVARAVADQVGIETVIAGVSPAGKANAARQLSQEGRQVVMIGDGVNDAPALAAADVGIAVGAAATRLWRRRTSRS